MLRSFALFVLLSACTEQSHGTMPRSAVAPEPAKADAQLPRWRGWRALPRLPDGTSPNDAHLAAVAAWRTATTAYARGDALVAAERFLESAAHLKGEGPEPIARTFAAGRCLAYENAARAYAAAKEFDAAEAKLTALATGDPSCQHSIAGALDRLKDDRKKVAFPPMWRSP